MRRLTVCLEAGAALREEGGAGVVDLAAAAMLAELAGAGGVRLAVNEEGRPVGEAELREAARVSRGFELRMPPVPMLVKTALESRPQRVVLAAAPRDGRHTAPLDFQAWGSALPPFVRTLEEAGIGVGVLVAPQPQAVKAAHGAGLRAVELHTAALVDLPPRERAEALAGLVMRVGSRPSSAWPWPWAVASTITAWGRCSTLRPSPPRSWSGGRGSAGACSSGSTAPPGTCANRSVDVTAGAARTRGLG